MNLFFYDLNTYTFESEKIFLDPTLNKMKFETISEYEILKHAYYHIMDKWLKRIERNDEYKKEYGRENKIERHWIDKYNEQLNELHEAICKLEQAETRE